jgi:hypothetical protein
MDQVLVRKETGPVKQGNRRTKPGDLKGNRHARIGRVFLVLCMVVLIPGVFAQNDPTVSGPVPVSQCETGAACSGGDDCINGVCHNPCEGRTNPFCACDCDITGPPPPPDGVVTWIILIGVAGIAAVGAALALKKRGQAPKTDEKDQKKQKEQTTYILQLSTDRITIEPDKPGTLTVMVWKQVGNKPPQQATDAAISITAPAAAAGLNVIPSTGQGTLTSQVRIGGSIQAGEFPLTVTARAAGGAEEATVIVKIEQDYVMEFF